MHGGEHDGAQADHIVGKLSSDELTFDRDGSFEIILSRQRRDGNWIALGDQPGSLITREFFDDAPAARREARWHIENLSAVAPTRIDDARIAAGLQSALNNVQLACDRYPRPIGQPVFGTGNVNEFAAFHQFTPTDVTGWGNLDAIHTTMPYALEPDEAIVIDGGRAVDCAWWGITQNNRYLASFGSGEPVGLAGREVGVDGAGTWTVVLSPVDPGLPNWLSTAGHLHGVVRIRWLVATAMPARPRTSVVNVRDLAKTGPLVPSPSESESGTTMGAKVDEAFIRRAVEMADLAAVRVALFQATGDPEVESLGPVAGLSADDREKLISKAVHYLQARCRGRHPAEAVRGRAAAFDGDGDRRPMTEQEFLARRDLPAFDERPWNAEWPDGVKAKMPEGFHVAVIGAGFSGLAAGAQFEHLGIPYTIYERRHEVGGVWSINKYPDARVDTASSTYEYNFEKNYPWTEYFARQTEVQGYLEYVAKKHGMWEHLSFNSDLKEARWDAERSVWHLTFARPDGSTFEADANAVVSAVGVFANPKFVDFAGSEQFGGKIVHPTQWSPDYDVAGKSVAVIGNGSTGVQLVAPIAQEAKQVYVFQRTAQWISPRPKYGQPIEPEIRWLLDTMPGYWNWQRYTATAALFESHDLMVPDPEWQANGGFVNKKNDAPCAISSPTTSRQRSVGAPTSSRSWPPTTRR